MQGVGLAEDLAEDLAQDALVIALEQWPTSGIPQNPGAWLMATAKRRAIDRIRRNVTLERKVEEIGRDLELQQMTEADFDAAVDDVKWTQKSIPTALRF